MKVLLVEPSRYDLNGKLIRRNSLFFPAITLPLLASLVPEGIDVKIASEVFEDINFEEKFDVVGITAYTSRILRAYEIADEFRKRGCYVVMGGMHVSSEPQEALGHADTVFIGEAEETWPKLLHDFQKESALKIYNSTESKKPSLDNLPVPDFSLLKLSRFLSCSRRGVFRFLPTPMLPVQTARGCPFGCEYCAVTLFFGGQYRMRPIPEVIKEIKTLKLRGCLFIDDNIFAVPDRAKELFRALTPLGIKWLGQGSINAALDRQMLRLARQSGCLAVLLGIESISSAAISSVRKNVNKAIDYSQALKIFREEDISVMASMIFGFTQDDDEAFDRTLEFLIKNRVTYTLWHPLVPFPGTPLYRRLKNEGRLIYDKWWLKQEAVADFLALKHDGLKERKQQFSQDFIKHYREFYSTGNIVKRILLPPQKRFPVKLVLNTIFRNRISRIGSMIEN